jgi:hypothetical protein
MGKQSCRTCRFLLVEPDKDGRRVPRASKAYRCDAPIPNVSLPASVPSWEFKWPPRKRWMEPDDGEACPAFEPWIKGQADD